MSRIFLLFCFLICFISCDKLPYDAVITGKEAKVVKDEAMNVALFVTTNVCVFNEIGSHIEYYLYLRKQDGNVREIRTDEYQYKHCNVGDKITIRSYFSY